MNRWVLQWALSPLGPAPLVPRTVKPPLAIAVWDALGGRSTKPQLVDSEVVQAGRAKQRYPGFAAVGRIGIVASKSRTRSLLVRVLAAFHTANAPGVHLRRLARTTGRVARAIAELGQAQRILATSQIVYAKIQDTLSGALTLVGRCDEIYRLGGPEVRRLANQSSSTSCSSTLKTTRQPLRVPYSTSHSPLCSRRTSSGRWPPTQRTPPIFLMDEVRK